jgi:hypothetical protein
MFMRPFAPVRQNRSQSSSGRPKYQRVVLLHTLPDEVNILHCKPREEP